MVPTSRKTHRARSLALLVTGHASTLPAELLQSHCAMSLDVAMLVRFYFGRRTVGRIYPVVSLQSGIRHVVQVGPRSSVRVQRIGVLVPPLIVDRVGSRGTVHDGGVAEAQAAPAAEVRGSGGSERAVLEL